MPLPNTRELDLARNLALLAAAEVLWGFGISIGFVHVVVQAFLHDLRQPEEIVGLAGACFGVGITLPVFFSGYFTEHLARRRGVVTLWHVLPGLPVAALAAWLTWGDAGHPAAPAIFVACYLGFTLAFGYQIPIWGNFVRKILPPRLLGRAFGVMYFFGQLAAAGGGWAFRTIQGRPGPDGSPIPGYALCFTLSAVAITLGGLPFALMREEPDPSPPPRRPFPDYVRSLTRLWREHGPLRLFILSEAAFFACVVGIHFYAYDAVKHFGASRRIAGEFTMVSGALTCAACLGMGWVGDRWGFRRVLLVGRWAMLGGLMAAAGAKDLRYFYGTAAGFGAFMGCRFASLFPFLFRLAGDRDATPHIALLNIVTGPFWLFIPLLGGLVIDRLTYPVTYGLACVAMAVGIGILTWEVDEENPKPHNNLIKT